MNNEKTKIPAFIYYNTTKAYCVRAEQDLQTKPVRVTLRNGQFSITTDFPDDIDPTTQMVFPSILSEEFKDFIDHYWRYRYVAGMKLVFRDGEWYDGMLNKVDIEDLIDDICKDIPETGSIYTPFDSLHTVLQFFPEYSSKAYKFDYPYQRASDGYQLKRGELLRTLNAFESLTFGDLIRDYAEKKNIESTEEFKNGLRLGMKIERLRQQSLAATQNEGSEDDFDEDECWEYGQELSEIEEQYYNGDITLDELLESGEYELSFK